MNDSSARDELDAKHERFRQHRIEAIKRWVEYIRETPPGTWGEQQNSLVDSQLQAARESGVTAEQRLRVERATRERSDDLDS